MKTKHYRRSHGNVKEQKKRRRQRRSAGVKPLKEPVELIDGNYSKYVTAYCSHYGAYLTLGLLETHRCCQRQCDQLVMMQDG